MYDVVYDVGRHYWEWTHFLALGFMILWTAFALTMVLWRNQVIAILGLNTPPPGVIRDILFGVHWIGAVVFSLIGIAVLVWLFSTFVGGYFDLQAAVTDGRCHRIAGVVTDFVAEDAAQGLPETFEVNGVEFAYEDSVSTGGFHRAGVLREGAQIQGCYVDRFGTNTFLRLEVRREPAI